MNMTYPGFALNFSYYHKMTLGCDLKANLDCIDLALLHSVNAVEKLLPISQPMRCKAKTNHG